jgi:outer membrane receptor for ferric coprogen and ferric-rhodotorulic acid
MLRKKTLALALAAAWGIQPAAWAAEQQKQDVQETSEAVLEQVNVNVAPSVNLPSEATGSYTVRGSSAATGLDLSLRETPQSISVITRSQMDDFRLNNINDVLDSVPGISVERVETDRTYYSARGSDITNFQIDGMGMPMPYGLVDGDIDTGVYDRIEVIRGANGLMSATGNPSATVNFVRKRPTADFNAEVEVSAGSWNNYRLEGDVSGALTEVGNLRGRVVAIKQDRDSYLDRNSHDKTVLYGILEADIGENTLLTLGHTFQDNNANGIMWGALPLIDASGRRVHYDVSASMATDWSYWDSRDHRTFAELTHAFANGWEVKGIVTHRRNTEDGKMFFVNGVTVDSMSAFPSKYAVENTQWIGDIVAKGPFTLGGREHQLIVGAQWARSDLEAESRYGTDFGPLTFEEMLAGTRPDSTYPALSGGADFRDKRQSFYSAVHLNVTDRLDLIGGARMTSVESTGETYGVPREVEHNNKVTPYAGIVYALTDAHSVYASYTDIFNPQSEVDINRRPLAPLEGKSVEAGIKSEWFGNRLNTTVALFRSKQDNVAEAAGTIPASFDTYYRGVKATTKGLEIDIAGEVTDRLRLQGGYSAMSLEGEDGDSIKTYVPRHMFTLTTTYRVPMIEKLKVGMDVKWRGDIHREIAGFRVEQESYALIDLMASYEIDKHTTLTLNVDNVTDRKYLTSLMWDQSLYGAPRSAMITLNWKY